MQKKLKISSQDKEALQLVKQLIEENFDSVPSINQLCKKSGLNGDKLKKGFKIVYGCPPYSFHLQMKMKEARRLLQETEQNINEIAWTLGYQHVSSFCTAFKKSAGKTALDWRGRNLL